MGQPYPYSQQQTAPNTQFQAQPSIQPPPFYVDPNIQPEDPNYNPHPTSQLQSQPQLQAPMVLITIASQTTTSLCRMPAQRCLEIAPPACKTVHTTLVWKKARMSRQLA